VVNEHAAVGRTPPW